MLPGGGATLMAGGGKAALNSLKDDLAKGLDNLLDRLNKNIYKPKSVPPPVKVKKVRPTGDRGINKGA